MTKFCEEVMKRMEESENVREKNDLLRRIRGMNKTRGSRNHRNNTS